VFVAPFVPKPGAGTACGKAGGVIIKLVPPSAILVDNGEIGPVVKLVANGVTGAMGVGARPRMGAGAKPVTGLAVYPETAFGANPLIVGVPRVAVVCANTADVIESNIPNVAQLVINFRFIIS
jgi:hypothetical protein